MLFQKVIDLISSLDFYFVDCANDETWDQFAANEKLFGVTTDFQDEIQTSKIDTTIPDFPHREAEAVRLAKEILKVYFLF